MKLSRIALVLTLAAAAGTTIAAAPYKHPRWADLDHNGRDTRADVLAAECQHVTWGKDGKHVRHAECFDLYSGAVVATDDAARALQIDHLYPASIAWSRRAWCKSNMAQRSTPNGCPVCKEQDGCLEFELFVNDHANLVPTRSRTNGQKGNRMPGRWCPSSPAARVLAAQRFRSVVYEWSLPLTPTDEAGLAAWAHGGCAAGARVLGSGR